MKAAYDKSHAIALAVEPLRADAVKRAQDWANSQVERMLGDLEVASWDIDRVAPAPRANKCDRKTYRTMQAKRNTFWQVCRIAHDLTRRDGMTIVYKSDENIARFVEIAGQDASAQYDAFICKMIKKIGECSTASLHGSHVWGHSHLTVTTPAGVEVWKTQQIVNVSPLGTVFNQWPSRKVSK